MGKEMHCYYAEKKKNVRIDKLRENVQCKLKMDFFTTVLCKGYVIS